MSFCFIVPPILKRIVEEKESGVKVNQNISSFLTSVFEDKWCELSGNWVFFSRQFFVWLWLKPSLILGCHTQQFFSDKRCVGVSSKVSFIKLKRKTCHSGFWVANLCPVTNSSIKLSGTLLPMLIWWIASLSWGRESAYSKSGQEMSLPDLVSRGIYP